MWCTNPEAADGVTVLPIHPPVVRSAVSRSSPWPFKNVRIFLYYLLIKGTDHQSLLLGLHLPQTLLLLCNPVESGTAKHGGREGRLGTTETTKSRVDQRKCSTEREAVCFLQLKVPMNLKKPKESPLPFSPVDDKRLRRMPWWFTGCLD